jgi:hypothetical protein
MTLAMTTIDLHGGRDRFRDEVRIRFMMTPVYTSFSEPPDGRRS